MASNAAGPSTPEMEWAGGCHLVGRTTPWIEGCESLSAAGLDAHTMELPDFTIDPESGLFSVINPSCARTRSAFVTFFVPLEDADGRILESGVVVDSAGLERRCTTLVVSVPPQHLIDVCYVHRDGTDIEYHSDIKEMHNGEEESVAASCVDGSDRLPPEVMSDTGVVSLGAPLQSGRYRCSQGFDGCFTHFFPGTRHAVDLLCDVGTAVCAVLDGKVVEVRQSNAAHGIDVALLFQWNSITLECCSTGGETVYVEYVHIAQGSAKVEVGASVRQGDVICLSGNVGFCPVPHLHLQVHRSRDGDAPTVPFMLCGRPAPATGEWIEF